MLQQALNRHSEIVIPPETGYFLDVLGHTRRGQRQHLRRINADLEIDVPPPERPIRQAREAIAHYELIAEAYLARRDGGEISYFGDKSPRHLLCIRQIVKLYPDAKFVLIYRDGRNVALSLSKVPWGPSDLYVNFAIWLRFYRWHQWALKSGAADLLCIKYEDFVRQPEPELRRVVEFLGLAYEPAMAEGAGNREGVVEREYGWKGRAFETIDDSRIDVWRNDLSAEQSRLLARWGGPALSSLGYELPPDDGGRLPLSFFPRLYWRHLCWRVHRLRRLMDKELLGR